MNAEYINSVLAVYDGLRRENSQSPEYCKKREDEFICDESDDLALTLPVLTHVAVAKPLTSQNATVVSDRASAYNPFTTRIVISPEQLDDVLLQVVFTANNGDLGNKLLQRPVFLEALCKAYDRSSDDIKPLIFEQLHKSLESAIQQGDLQKVKNILNPSMKVSGDLVKAYKDWYACTLRKNCNEMRIVDVIWIKQWILCAARPVLKTLEYKKLCDKLRTINQRRSDQQAPQRLSMSK